MPNKEVVNAQNDVERLEIREQTKSKSEAKWKYKVRCKHSPLGPVERGGLTSSWACVMRESSMGGLDGPGCEHYS